MEEVTAAELETKIMDKVEPAKGYTCDYCAFCCLYENAFEAHLKKKHGNLKLLGLSFRMFFEMNLLSEATFVFESELNPTSFVLVLLLFC